MRRRAVRKGQVLLLVVINSAQSVPPPSGSSVRPRLLIVASPPPTGRDTSPQAMCGRLQFRPDRPPPSSRLLLNHFPHFWPIHSSIGSFPLIARSLHPQIIVPSTICSKFQSFFNSYDSFLKMSVRDLSQERMASQERETPFAGYGDRVGSGVAYTATQWKGGELVTDPALVHKSIKPRRVYYSPIGDGVVAADGVELKRLPPDLTPKMEVIQQKIVEKSDRGRPGVRITEKTWSTGGPTEDSLKGYGHTGHPNEPSAFGAGRGSRASEPDAFANLADQLGPSARPASAQSAPAPTRNGFGGDVGAADVGVPKDWKKGPPPFAGDGAPSRHPKNWGDGGPEMAGQTGAGGPNIVGPHDASSRSTPLDFAKSPVANGLGAGGANDLPLSGRSSAASTGGLYEPGMRYEIRKDYRVTNPRELIHQYATTTPVTVIDPSLETTRTITRQHYTQTVEESFGPYPPYTSPPNVPSPLKFVKQLRDETMTESQRQANRQQHSMSASSRDSNFEQRVDEIRRSTSRQASNDPLVEQLSSRLQSGLK